MECLLIFQYSGKFVRASKYRHVFGQATKKELCYENLKITKNAWDSNIIDSNGKYLSVNWDSSGGGAFAVIPLSEVGKAPDTVPLFRGHKGPVLDTQFNPFNQQQIVSCSDDGKICLWEIPEDYSFHKYLDESDNIKDITEPVKVLSGHTRKVGHVEFHPCAENILASCSMDYTVKIWNLDTGKDEITLQHKDLVTSLAFNYNGSLLATTSRDKKIRIWDIRSGKVLSEGPGHTGAKPSRVVWLGNTDRILTTGFSRLSDRQVGIWDVNNIEAGAIDGFLVIDSSSGVLIPVFDESNNILYLAGKGDGNIRYFEYENDILHELSQFSSTDPQRGFAVSPKFSVNVKENEVLKSFKTVNDNSIEPISFIVPRRSELFQLDIYPDCPSQDPALTAQEFLDGKECNGPLLMSMESLYEGTKPSIRESDASISVSSIKEEAALAKKEEKQAKEKDLKEKKESPKEVKSVEKPKNKEFTPESSQTPKNVDELLKSSDDVNALINKVNDESDDEGNQKAEEKDDEWEEVKKPELSLNKSANDKQAETKREEAKKEQAKKEEARKEEARKEEARKEEAKKEEAKKEEAKKEEAKKEEAKKEEAKKESNSSSTSATSASKTTSGGGPTLKGTVEKLATLVEKLEAQVVKLTEAGLEKDAKLSSLEGKINELLKK
ncbi:uncharacterized protein AC631_02613 [Debaryomyces fabryi]|uniref:Coronin n=1 Tax=Debaryomyces fabryi TaxID=58627 RepID=A0A0V1PZB0_9ASCO|nr:uncharacterized protein AC631_02613 [Debaryomyces fabryi]KSA01604.1 hypothetical protein AC631_02613 [Debaryomyces fabryi]CUM47138.1 unnamed protein product [Debaryomyces fabryi]